VRNHVNRQNKTLSEGSRR